MQGKKLKIGALAAALLALTAFAGVARAQNGDTATYIGAEACAECHSEIAEAMPSTPHGQAGFARLSNQGCEACHGPGSLHMEDPAEHSMRLTDRPVREQAETCRTCHDGGNQFLWPGSMHESRGLSCISCHGVHTFKSDRAQLIKATVMDQCIDCHKDVRAELWKNSHHPIREGRISCVDCHNPHGTGTDKLIAAASVNEQCYACHAEKRGPFLWEHAPVRESCLNCHTPHGSNHIKLQKTSVPYICQQCHANTRHPGTLYDNKVLPTLENPATGSNRLFNRACLDCHAAIHGSNHPSSPYLAH